LGNEGGPVECSARVPPSRQERRHRSTDRWLTRSLRAMTAFFPPRANNSAAAGDLQLTHRHLCGILQRPQPPGECRS
jgi:hypothetical protein